MRESLGTARFAQQDWSVGWDRCYLSGSECGDSARERSDYSNLAEWSAVSTTITIWFGWLREDSPSRWEETLSIDSESSETLLDSAPAVALLGQQTHTVQLIAALTHSAEIDPDPKATFPFLRSLLLQNNSSAASATHSVAQSKESAALCTLEANYAARLPSPVAVSLAADQNNAKRPLSPPANRSNTSIPRLPKSFWSSNRPPPSDCSFGFGTNEAASSPAGSSAPPWSSCGPPKTPSSARYIRSKTAVLLQKSADLRS